MSSAVQHTQPKLREAPWTFEAALKDATVEELVNFHLHRRLAFLLIKPLQGRFESLTPNHITLFSGVLGVCSGICAYRSAAHGPQWLALGALLLLLSAVVDCADGMLARLRRQSSDFGMLLDGLMDLVTGISAWYGISHAVCAGIEVRGEWWICFFALVSVVAHVALYDQLKGKFNARTRLAMPTVPVALPSNAAPSTFERLIGGMYRSVYGSVLKTLAGDDTAPSHNPAAARRQLTPAMRKATYLGLGTQLCVLYVAALLGALTHVAVTLIFAELVLCVFFNGWIFVVLASWKRGEAQLRAELEGA